MTVAGAIQEGSFCMLRVMALTVLVFAQTSIGAASAMCAGADPAIASVAVKSVTSEGRLNRYHLSLRVANLGQAKQASNVLQSVDIYENGIKRDAKGIPPLKPGQSYTYTYDYVRSLDAGEGTSDLTFQLNVRQTSSSRNCSVDNDRYTLHF